LSLSQRSDITQYTLTTCSNRLLLQMKDL